MIPTPVQPFSGFNQQFSCPDTALLVRGLDRVHGRVQIFTRSLSDAVSTLGSVNSTSSVTQWDTDPIGPSSLSAPNGSSTTSNAVAFGDRTVVVCQNCLTTALQLANRVSEARTQWYLDGLCLRAMDSITDLRQKLVSINAAARARSGFREQFSLVQLREKLVVGYLKFLLTFFDDLTKTAAGRVPGPILLLLAKLCLTWTSTGTIGQFLTICEDLLSSGKSVSYLVSFGSHVCFILSRFLFIRT
ncbi:unnamed protein product [Echinostoma caproni]|uniref:UDENN domain-containing protein n=1 Tax=Echinostoma caproni TaxID=27848 RepID=A0A183B7P3_9TREM|nr:unnamed protein product [Echinostoma caproni]